MVFLLTKVINRAIELHTLKDGTRFDKIIFSCKNTTK